MSRGYHSENSQNTNRKIPTSRVQSISDDKHQASFERKHPPDEPKTYDNIITRRLSASYRKGWGRRYPKVGSHDVCADYESQGTERVPSKEPFPETPRASSLNQKVNAVGSVGAIDKKYNSLVVPQIVCSSDLPPPFRNTNSEAARGSEKQASSLPARECERSYPLSANTAKWDAENDVEQTSFSGGKNASYSSNVSKSVDRRIHEAAQYAEAIGAVPPTDASSFPDIIEEDNSSSEDDEDEGSTEVDNILEDNTEILLQRISQHEEGIDNSDEFSYVYRGIRHNPPEITKRGISRGNYAQLHRKAWLEVSDKYHRYGKNLRLYYKHWEKLGYPTNKFFDWIDSKGEAAGAPLPNRPGCPRSQLDCDTVLYITDPQIQARYALSVDVREEDGIARIVDVNGKPISTGPDGWIFVLRDNILYGSQKVTSVNGKSKQRFHHSSFFGGKAVAAAGIFITDKKGYLMRLYPHSGHYRPGEAHMQRILYFLEQLGVDLKTFDVDMQQILHVSRKHPPQGKLHSEENGKEPRKSKKVQSLKLQRGFDVACFLAHKTLMIDENVFHDIHKIRRLGNISVGKVLETIDDGGHWRNLRLKQGEQ
uniref:Uncharacterized protein n=1 Tax=Helicotheca tamesis TaxID=374047 RepID=A0A7S2IJP1_9STRA|mmetsp:Transcript_9901/g.13836  ORF Transcript_9901/g.13836 Transcript_9901/m.13836 type:complete len:595 (+) Transcript_9901:31-1815(+)